MNARDDYPTLAALADDGLPLITNEAVCSFRDALDEIDQLRADVAKLLAKLATTDAAWP